VILSFLDRKTRLVLRPGAPPSFLTPRPKRRSELFSFLKDRSSRRSSSLFLERSSARSILPAGKHHTKPLTGRALASSPSCWGFLGFPFHFSLHEIAPIFPLCLFLFPPSSFFHESRPLFFRVVGGIASKSFNWVFALFFFSLFSTDFLSAYAITVY